MSCMAGLHVKGLLSRGCLSANYKATDFTSVNITFKRDATTVGGAARDHMMSAARLGLCDVEAQVFTARRGRFLVGSWARRNHVEYLGTVVYWVEESSSISELRESFVGYLFSQRR